MPTATDDWTEPPWQAPLDVDAALRAIPPDATMTGVFLAAVTGLATVRGIALQTARSQYAPLQRYPLREHCELMVELAQTVFPELSMRAALRKIGRGAPHALIESKIGRVVLGAGVSPVESIRTMARSYQLHLWPCGALVEPHGTHAAIVRMTDVYNFLDSHNVGVFEGLMRYAHVEGTLKMRSYSSTAADFLCTWAGPTG